MKALPEPAAPRFVAEKGKGVGNMKLILLGAPGAGKGTQAQFLCTEYAIPQISTGDMLRKAIADGTDLGRSAKSYMDNGELVPDEVVVGIVDERLKESDCQDGFILDGFPRTTAQAEALGAAGVSIDRVVHIAVGEDALVERLAGRRSCIGCGAMFHVAFAAPAQEGICDSCGKELVQRADDNPETVRERLRVYSDKTAPLVEFYGAEGNLVTVDGEGTTHAITGRITAVLGGNS